MSSHHIFLDPSLPCHGALKDCLQDYLVEDSKEASVYIRYAHDSNMELSPLNEYIFKCNQDIFERTIFLSWFKFDFADKMYQYVFGSLDDPLKPHLWNDDQVVLLQLPVLPVDILNLLKQFPKDVR